METKAKTKTGFEKIFKRILLVCSILLTAELVWLFVVTPCAPLSSVDIKTIDGVTRNDVLAMAGITPRSSYMSVNVKEVEESLMRNPLISSAQVIKHFPEDVEIVLSGREPCAVSLASVNGKSIPLFYDKEGVIFKIGNKDVPNIPSTVPLISGLQFGNIVIGTKLPEFLLPLLDDIEEVKTKSPELLSVISEIHVSKKTYDGFDLILYPAYNTVKIRLGADLKDETLRYMLLLLDVLKEKNLHVDEIDFRTGTASYTVKGI
ncbi:cell division protein FtsQ [Spirochaetia bacterium]|nr:cell division protein FtsQ [Spirochaetia bacterium]